MASAVVGSSAFLGTARLASDFLRGAAIPGATNGPTAGTHAPAWAPLQVSASKKLQGKVLNNMRDKTVAVEVKRIFPHPKYKKRITTSKKYQVHDPLNECNVGDWVTLGKCAPVSKTKFFVVTDIRRKKVAGAQRHTTELNENMEPVLPPLESEVSAEVPNEVPIEA